jgi:hypothetical protein
LHAKFVLLGNKIQRRTKIPTNGNGWTSGPIGSLGHEVIVRNFETNTRWQGLLNGQIVRNELGCDYHKVAK